MSVASPSQGQKPKAQHKLNDRRAEVFDFAESYIWFAQAERRTLYDTKTRTDRFECLFGGPLTMLVLDSTQKAQKRRSFRLCEPTGHIVFFFRDLECFYSAFGDNAGHDT